MKRITKDKKKEIDGGVLYVIATPIGNMADITLRALDVIKELDLLLCEDTRTTGNLLAKYGINTKLSSYNSYSTKDKNDKVILLLKEGKKIGLVSDAGTPTISDPGVHLVKNILNELGDSVDIVPIPGASAVISALSVSGLNASDFLFLGFLPHKKGRETLFKEISLSKRTVIFYESTHRVLKTLDSLDKFLAKDRIVVIARELTKMFEEIKRGNVLELKKHFVDNIKSQKGEFVFMVEGKE